MILMPGEQFERKSPTFWGFVQGDRVLELPQMPMLQAGYGPPPFDVKLPSGEIRRIVEIAPTEVFT